MDRDYKPYQLPPDRLVAFIDILGFRNLVTGMQADLMNYYFIRDLLKETAILLSEITKPVSNHNNEKISKPLDSLETTIFSDSIVLSCPISETNPKSEIFFISFSQFLSARLLRNGISVRGGIARGWCYHKDNIVFGEGLIKAYDLESKVASFPRIVLDDEVVTRLENHKNDLNNFIKLDSDGFWFIDTIKLCIGHNPMPEDVINVSLEDCRIYIQRELNDSKAKEPNIEKKYRWLAIQFNDTLDRMEKEYRIDYLSKYKIPL